MERWHVALTAMVAGEFRHMAVELKVRGERGDVAASDNARERGELWRKFSERISEHAAGVDGVKFTAADVELVRMYRLIQSRQMMRRDSKKLRDDRCAQVDHLTHSLLASLPESERLKCADVPALRDLLP